MVRWWQRRLSPFITGLGKGSGQGKSVLPRAQGEWRAEPLEDQWVTLRRHCIDESSTIRLSRLFRRLAHDDAGVKESALAELELATRLVQAGVRLTFLPETRARSADLECQVDRERFFVEVTAMVGTADRGRIPFRKVADVDEQSEEESRGTILIHRILARVQQKARQLVEYCEPVVLQISVPRVEWQEGCAGQRKAIWLDVKVLAGAVTVLLMRLPHLSAVLIVLWDVEPLPWRAGARLANVDVLIRASHQRTVPRVRLLVRNPRADAPLTERQCELLRAIL